MLATFYQRRCQLKAALAPVLAGAALVMANAEVPAAEAGLLHLRCTNAVGGANWPIVVDLDRGLVDSQPATITKDSLEWHDAKGGMYELDRASGKLLLRGASSTGGFFLHYTCKPE